MKRNRCVIDLGSNSVRLRIARQTASGGFETVAEEREMVRLGGNIVSTGSIDPRAVSDTLGVMRRFRSLLARHRIHKVLVFATAAIRDASNGADVALAIQDVLGVPVRVLSTREEGEFLLRGARRRYALDRVHGVIADLGGGSLQVVRTMRGFAVENVSLPIGALRMTGRFGTGKFSVSGYERMSAWVRTQLRGTLRSTMPRCEFLAGAGGGFASSESMAQAVGYRRKIPRSELARQIRKLRGMTIDERCRVPGLESKRADIIVPSLCVIHELMKLIGAAHFVNYGDGVRDGMLVEAFEGPEVECQDIVGSSAELAARAPKVLKHAQQVRFLAIKMAAALESMDSRRFAFIGRRLPVLESAALLHDVGVSIDYSEHHQWSARIVSAEVFSSIDEHERAMVSELVRHHRRTPLDIKTARRVGFDASQARELVVLSNILRAADALDRSHRSRVQDIQMGRERGGAGWIRIRCRGPLNDELRALRKKGGALLSLIARDVRVEIR